jgi:NodT family efflux transporter outer membrane factor (OMF) lipoprotein
MSRRRASSRFPVLSAAMLAVLASGCALQAPPTGEELNREAYGAVVPPAAWTGAATAAGPVEDGWVESFGDEQLEALVAEAIAHNTDLRAAAAAVEQAAAYVRMAGGNVYPAVNLLASTSSSGGDGYQPLNRGILMASWELDLWGRVRYGARAAEDQYAAASADFAYAQQSIAALVARGWLTACEAGLQHQLAAEAVAGAERLLALATERERVGIGSEVEVALARANVEGFRDARRQLVLGKEQALRSLELLLGRYPAADLEAATSLPAIADPVPAGVPAELLERRPDVVAAERRVAAAYNSTEQAKAARLPRISLSANVSYLESDILVLQDRENPALGLGLGLLMPIYAGGSLAAQVELKTAEQRAAVAQYASVGLRAFGEVENALSAEQAALDREAILESQVRDSERALELEQVRYRVGNTDLRSVTQQQMAVYGARSSLLRIQAERVTQRVNLYLALGGGIEKAPG